MSKRLISYLAVVFTLLLLMQAVVSIFIYDAQLRNIRRKFKWETLTSLKNEQLTLVKVAKVLETNNNQYFKRIHGREFRFLGEMYDIVRKTEQKDTTYYYCFHDRDETGVIKTINKWMKDNFGNSDNDTKGSKFSSQIFKQPYVAANSLQLFPPKVVKVPSVSIYYPLHQTYIGVFAPPPEMAALYS